MNSLVLHCASPAAHNIATSKVAVIFNMFNGHPKRGNKAPFCSRNAFNSDFDYSTRLKSVYLETRPSLFEECTGNSSSRVRIVVAIEIELKVMVNLKMCVCFINSFV